MATLQQLDRIENAGRIAVISNIKEMRRYIKIHLDATQLGRDALKALKQDDKEGVRNFLNQIVQLGKER